MTPKERAAALDLEGTILDRAAHLLEDPSIVGGAMLGAAQVCRQLARFKRDEARRLRRGNAPALSVLQRIRQRGRGRP